METLTISPDFQVSIPESFRDRLKLSPGQEVQAIHFDNHVQLIPVKPAQQLRGFLRGINTDVPCEQVR